MALDNEKKSKKTSQFPMVAVESSIIQQSSGN